MLNIIVPGMELWDESNREFIVTKDRSLQLEHSLVSISKWESKWHKIYLSKKQKTEEEAIDYIRCMTITQNVDDALYMCLSDDNLKEINAYIENPMSAVIQTKSEGKKTGVKNRENVTSELIYYWMISLNIPFECQKWHLNRLLSLIEVCNVRNQPPQKLSKKELISRNTALNEARRKELKTNG